MQTPCKIENIDADLPFRPASLEDQPVVDGFMRQYGEGSCQHSFTALYTLNEKYGSEICLWNGFLLVLRRGLCGKGERVYLAPLGEGDRKAAYQALLDDAAAHACRAVFETITLEQAAFLKSRFPGRFAYEELRDYAEYIYSTESLTAMAGSKFADKRNKIRNILRTYGSRLTVKTLGAADIPAIRAFARRWLADNAQTHDEQALERELRTIELQLEHFDTLGLRGVGIYIDETMEAFAYGVPLNECCFDGLIAKANRNIPHLYKLLYREISCLSAADYPYFNWEEDVGVEGLRNMKMEYSPAVLLRKFVAREQDNLIAGDDKPVPVRSALARRPGEELLPGSLAELRQSGLSN